MDGRRKDEDPGISREEFLAALHEFAARTSVLEGLADGGKVGEKTVVLSLDELWNHLLTLARSRRIELPGDPP